MEPPLSIVLGMLGLLIAVLLVVGGGAAVNALRRRFDTFRRLISDHLNGPCSEATLLTHPVRDWERVNYHLALEKMRAEASTPLLAHAAPAWVQLSALAVSHQPKQPITHLRLPCGYEETAEVPENVVYLLRCDGQPFCARLANRAASDPDIPSGLATSTMEVLADTPEAARAALDRLQRLSRDCNVYRGKAIALVEAPNGGDFFKVEFQDIPATLREDIILPEELLTVVERNVIGFLTHAETLKKSGRSTRHGVLLHGPPGVGKTLVTRYLVEKCKGYTTILLSGRNLHFIRESMMLARLLAPSIVIFEDVDLVAEERTTNRFGTVLHEMLEALDGLGRKTECIVLMTTNRPELLEPALATRPGRVDQAIALGLPDAECRKRLLNLYGQGLDLAAADLDSWVERTDGVSPAFLAEWLRKTALMAAERGETEVPLRVTPADMESAFRELVLFGGKTTQRILGFRAADVTRNGG